MGGGFRPRIITQGEAPPSALDRPHPDALHSTPVSVIRYWGLPGWCDNTAHWHRIGTAGHLVCSSARFSSRTLIRGSPRKPRNLSCACFVINDLTTSSSSPRVRATRGACRGQAGIRIETARGSGDQLYRNGGMIVRISGAQGIDTRLDRIGERGIQRPSRSGLRYRRSDRSAFRLGYRDARPRSAGLP